jgi:hypothetical protein
LRMSVSELGPMEPRLSVPETQESNLA